MEQSQAMEYGSQKASSNVLKPRNIYIYICYVICDERFSPGAAYFNLMMQTEHGIIPIQICVLLCSLLTYSQLSCTVFGPK
jgi:hypothetical protein